MIPRNPSTVVPWFFVRTFSAVAPGVVLGNIDVEQSSDKVIFVFELKEGNKCGVGTCFRNLRPAGFLVGV